MNEKIIPADARLAAKRGFIRTTAQAGATALAGGISTTVLLSVVSGEVELVPTLITWGVAILSPFLAGGASYLTILSQGIPVEYIPDSEPLGFVEESDFDEEPESFDGAVDDQPVVG